jgi:membrane protease YdiL (CAAX protease family)
MQGRPGYTAGVSTTPSTGVPVPQPWQRHPVTQLLAAIACVTPLYALSIASGLRSIIIGDANLPTAGQSATGAVLTASVFLAWMLVLLYVVCGERLGSLQLRSGRWASDVKQAAALFLLLLAVVTAYQVLAGLAGNVEVPDANRGIAEALARDNRLLLAWLGPVVWLQAALLEELYRTFTLSRLWRVWPGPLGRMLTVFASALLFGMGHIYQGPVGMAVTALIGAVLGLHYMKCGRVLPLILAHGVYDTAMLVTLAALARSGVI